MASSGRGARALAAPGIVVLLVAAAGADPVGKWRTPEGSLWFGQNAPEGSVWLGEIEGLEATEGGRGDASAAPEEATSEAAREGRERMRERAEQRAVARERRQALREAVELATQAVIRGNLGWVIVGSVRNRAADPVHDVRVGAGGVWESTEPETIPAGGEATFRLEVPSYPYTEYDAVPPVEIDWKERHS